MRFIKPFKDLCIDDVSIVGGKNASLGEMYRSLTSKGVLVPNGFATTADAFRFFLEHNGLDEKIYPLLDKLERKNIDQLQKIGATIRHWIARAEMPTELADQIRAAYKDLERENGENPDVAVRSSATAEDLPTASFAGQQETYLNIRGSYNLVETVKKVYASLFTNRAIAYRIDNGFSHRGVALSAGIQKMVRSDIGAAGVMFTLDTESGFRDVVFITAAYGLGENVVQGAVNPDEYYVFKPTLAKQHRTILKRHRGEKAIKMIYTSDPVAGHSTTNIAVSREDRERFALTDNEVLQLAQYAITIENHYSKRADKWMPMDIEWAKDGNTNELYIVQARPETVQTQHQGSRNEMFRLKKHGEVITHGKAVGRKIAAGRARIILHASEMNQLNPGEILITDITDPDWEPIMKKAGGIVTNRGGRTCHAAIVARELGIPAVVGCENATEVIDSDDEITVVCSEGDTGTVYRGILPFDREEIDISKLEKPKTQIMMNLGNPDIAFESSKLPVSGVGLARLEFIINNSIRIHPMALIDYDKLDRDTQIEIDRITAGYADRISYYVDKLAEGVATIAAAFYPKPVIVRMSDFKSNEYAALIGGSYFEPKEENPMIGFRGASRYPSPKFSRGFALECLAMKRVREAKGLTNVSLMIPFVRTVDEARNVLDIMESNGLKRGVNDLRIYLMCEIPANAILADQFLAMFDGFSIGSNDLTQLTLGVDRDSGMITGFDERNEAVLALMDMAIAACKRHQKYIGICGQAPSDYPEITRWLVEKGISSISLNPDSVIPMTQVVIDAEKRIR